MTLYSMSHEDITRNLNEAKEVLLAGLEREGLLKAPASEISSKYAMAVHKKGWFGSMWARLFSPDKQDELKITLVKQV